MKHADKTPHDQIPFSIDNFVTIHVDRLFSCLEREDKEDCFMSMVLLCTGNFCHVRYTVNASTFMLEA